MGDIESHSEYQELNSNIGGDDDYSQNQKNLKYNIMAQYNIVIKQHNKEINRVDEQLLKFMKENRFFMTIFPQLQTHLKYLLATIILFIPGFNFILYVCIVTAFMIYLKQYKIYKSNSRRVEDPFQNMIFSPEMCDAVDKDYHMYEFPYKSMEDGMSFNMDVFDNLKERTKEGENMRFTVYNINFANYYKQFPKYKGWFIRWLVFGFIIMGLSSWATYAIIESAE